MATVRKPDHVKYRREGDHGLVYDHENYGYEDASLTTVHSRIVDLLEYVDGSPRPREDLDAAFEQAVVEAAVEEGYVRGD
ncbi:mycofactocin biosynthesis chaperone MftB2 [Haloarculaceae archaeon H-GB2-1]|nr:hypothetical protein [Haloarculaceae archaeon H-GB1-1]MEA5388197.1 mycofactocin biosynthesis chaperone MftB2 [Haloarculaceae archaeon H-GB11]MEA5406217.1 mycofactocin biosynthesis chaperone MftB2 [Haloarculaceae archaeon H-GB2-1]